MSAGGEAEPNPREGRGRFRGPHQRGLGGDPGEEKHWSRGNKDNMRGYVLRGVGAEWKRRE